MMGKPCTSSLTAQEGRRRSPSCNTAQFRLPSVAQDLLKGEAERSRGWTPRAWQVKQQQEQSQGAGAGHTRPPLRPAARLPGLHSKDKSGEAARRLSAGSLCTLSSRLNVFIKTRARKCRANSTN